MGRYLTKADMAEKFQVTQRTIEEWVRRYGMPHFHINRSVLRFREADVDRWAEQRMQEVTA